MFVFIDLESLPEIGRHPSEYLDEVKVPANYKDPVKIREYQLEHAVKVWENTALDALRAQVFAICVGTDDDSPRVFMDTKGTPEGEANVMTMLNKWYLERFDDHPQAPQPIWCGHYALEFDFRVLFLRAARLGMGRLAKSIRPRSKWGDDHHKDTFQACGGGSLDALAKYFGITRPVTIPGAGIREAFARERFAEIHDHVFDDVVTLQKVAAPLRAAGVL